MIAAAMVISSVVGAISSIDAIMRARTEQGAIAWAVLLNAFPYVAVPAVLSVQLSFAEDCYWATGKQLELSWVPVTSDRGSGRIRPQAVVLPRRGAARPIDLAGAVGICGETVDL